MKSKEVSILVIASLILLPFVGGESFAQSNQVLTVTTEKESYAAGEPIEVFGLVDIRLEGVEALIRVVSPVGNMVDVDQIAVDADVLLAVLVEPGVEPDDITRKSCSTQCHEEVMAGEGGHEVEQATVQ